MDILSPAFFSALAAIVLIDLVLAGDNAIVIALASRNLPPHLRKRAILWGSLGAVAVRSVMTVAVVWLLKIPGLLAVGGLMLLWIAYRLLVNEEHEGKDMQASSSFFGAMRTIIVADAVMGVDNVLAVAGAAHGSYLLVVLGLLISIPIVVWGSTLILRLTERFPVIIYIGAGVLVITGMKMFMNEPLLKTSLADHLWVRLALYALSLGGVLGWGYFINQTRRVRRAVRIHAQVRREFKRGSQEGGKSMDRVLLPIDGSSNALAAVRRVVEEYRQRPERLGRLEVLLLNVQPSFSRHVAQFLSRKSREAYRESQSEQALRPARELLEQAGVNHSAYTVRGDKAEAIGAFAKQHDCGRVVVGTARKNSLTRLLENSVTTRLLETAPVPVQVIVGRDASGWERYGVPLGVGLVVAAWLLLN